MVINNLILLWTYIQKRRVANCAVTCKHSPRNTGVIYTVVLKYNGLIDHDLISLQRSHLCGRHVLNCRLPFEEVFLLSNNEDHLRKSVINTTIYALGKYMNLNRTDGWSLWILTVNDTILIICMEHTFHSFDRMDMCAIKVIKSINQSFIQILLGFVIVKIITSKIFIREIA
jgi:hypothetical protein